MPFPVPRHSLAFLALRGDRDSNKGSVALACLQEDSFVTPRVWQKAEAGASRDSLQPEMQAIRQRTEQQIEGVLTERQRATYRELREQMRNRRGNRPPQQG